MNVDDRFELFFEYLDIAYSIAKTYCNGRKDIEHIITDYALNG